MSNCAQTSPTGLTDEYYRLTTFLHISGYFEGVWIDFLKMFGIWPRGARDIVYKGDLTWCIWEFGRTTKGLKKCNGFILGI